MSSLLEELRQLEVELHRSDTRRNVARLQELLHADFEEFGRSGRRFSRDQILSEFAANTEILNVVSLDFRLMKVGDGIALLTYVSAHKGESGKLHRHTLRSSLWVRGDRGWQMLFHQGTPTDG